MPGLLAPFSSLEVSVPDAVHLNAARALARRRAPSTFEEYKKVRSNPLRHYYMAECSARGLGVPRNTERAYRGYSLAALEGNYRAQLRLWEGVKRLQKWRWLLPPLMGTYFASSFHWGVALNQAVVLMLTLLSGASWMLQRRQDPAVVRHRLGKLTGLLLWLATVAVLQCAGAALIGYPVYWLMQQRVPADVLATLSFYPRLGCLLAGAHVFLTFMLPRL